MKLQNKDKDQNLFRKFRSFSFLSNFLIEKGGERLPDCSPHRFDHSHKAGDEENDQKICSDVQENDQKGERIKTRTIRKLAPITWRETLEIFALIRERRLVCFPAGRVSPFFAKHFRGSIFPITKEGLIVHRRPTSSKRQISIR